MAGLSDPAYFAVEQYRPATMECVLASAIRRNVPANVLLAIGEHEAGKDGSAIRNSNGTYDFGRTGINTKWVEDIMPQMRQYGVTQEQVIYYLRYDGCYNYDMAAYKLQRHLLNCDLGFWTCAARYHSKTPEPNLRYQGFIIPLAAKWERYLKQHYPVRSIGRD